MIVKPHHHFTHVLLTCQLKTWNPRRNFLEVDDSDPVDVEMSGAEDAATVVDAAADAGVAVSIVFDSFDFLVWASFRYLS